jgi:hypothetical protein
MLSGVMLLWFILVGLAMLFVAIDIRSTPTSPVMKWAFVLITAYTGVIGAFLYVLGCREPLPGIHEQYVASRWRQTLGSTMHCVAGDGVGILAGAVIGSTVHLSGLWEISLEYALGFGFGWTIFQALFMKGMGGSYAKSLASTFVAELVSMNVGVLDVAPARQPQSVQPGVLVHYVDELTGRTDRDISGELVAGEKSLEAWHDDRAPPWWRTGGRCGRRGPKHQRDFGAPDR